jgi:beta-lactamase regulating signal transducer with metallopeptidase domain
MNGIAMTTALALVHFLWQGALVGLATGGILALLERKNASTRYAVAAGSLLVLAALPVLTAFQLVPAQAEGLSEVPSTVVIPASAPVQQAPPESLPADATAVRTFGASLLPWVLGLWLAGVAALASYHLGGWRLARRLSRQGRPAAAAITSLGVDLCRRFGIHRWVAFLESTAVSVPTVIGWLRPVVLVPASALAGLSPSQLEAILAHELAHVRRHDYLVNLFQTAVETLLFYHPAVWWVSSQVRRERENCCDDLAVAVCGDRLSYARALMDLEGLRTSPRFALAASGGSLSDRIRRLAGMPAGRTRRSWAAGALALSLLPAGTMIQFARSGPSEPEVSSSSVRLAAAAAPAAGRAESGRRGTWSLERQSDGRVWLEMRMRSENGRHNWSSSSTFPESELQGLGAGPEVRFEIRRDAGTFHFEGRLEGKQGTGFFTFAGNPAYARDMAAMGYRVSEDRLLEMALHDVSLSFVREIHELGYRDATLDKLVEFRIHGVSPAFIRDMMGLGYRDVPADRLVEFRIHGVSPEFVRGLADSGYRDIPPERLVEFRIHGVSPSFVRELAEAGYRDLSPERLVEFRIHGVSPAYVRELAEAGYRDLPAERLVEFRIHGVNAEFIRKAASRGYRNLSASDLVELKIMGRLDRER